MNKKNRLMQKLLLSFMTTIIFFLMAFAVGELWARKKYAMLNLVDTAAWEGRKGDYFTYDETLGWKGKPGVAGPHGSGCYITHNDRGYRDTPWDVHTDKIKVLLLGDSNMWGYGVNDDEYPGALLNAMNPDVRWFNAGMNGYGTDQQYLTFLRVKDELKPDWTVLVVCGNDRRENTSKRVRNYDKPYFTVENDALVLQNVPVPHSEKGGASRTPIPLAVFKKTHSYLLYHFSRIYEHRVSRDKSSGKHRSKNLKVDSDPTHAIVKALFDAANGHLIVIPMSVDKPLAAFCKNEGIPFADMSKSRARQPGPLQYPSGAPKHAHWTPEGNRVAARFIYDATMPYLKK